MKPSNDHTEKQQPLEQSELVEMHKHNMVDKINIHEYYVNQT
jgi:hypothetical protein